MKTNCWDAKHCGREPGGQNVGPEGPCPASLERRLDGVHGGINAGHACLVVAGTLCGGKAQGSYARKVDTCLNCDFYREVQADEGVRFEFTHSLLKRVAS